MMKNRLYSAWALRLLLLLLLPCISGAADPYPNHEVSLNGSWSFKYIQGLDAGEDEGFFRSDFDASKWEQIKVPANWEMEGFAEPHYALKLADGLGLYRRTFEVPEDWSGELLFLRFDGVAFGFELWVNGRRVGQSTASAFNRHSFEITDFVRTGVGATNTLALRVTSKPLGWEFDANDDWALCGIYRDVTLFSVPQKHIKDLATDTHLGEGGLAKLSFELALSSSVERLSATLLGPGGERLGQLDCQIDGMRAVGTIDVPDAKLWTAETPDLYRLRLELFEKGEAIHTIEERLGLREMKVVGTQILLNGRPIKLRGVNRHDLAPDVGRAVSERHFRMDLERMKEGNINFIRTSHYPPHPRFIELCDEYGFYVMCEVSIGKGEEHLDKPEYRETIMDRARFTVERDKNRASVIIWSIGNENPVTEVEMAAGRLVKELDPTRPICIPKIGSYFEENYKQIPEFVDVYSPHYPNIETLEKFSETLDRPTLLTEYAHALGLATDRIQEEWEIIQESENIAGGAIWHFMDQGILRRSADPVNREESTPYVWLDEYNYYDTNKVDGCDGIVYSDRRPQTDFWLTRKVYSPVQIREENVTIEPGQRTVPLRVENRYDFISLEGAKLAWSLQRNGREFDGGEIALSAPSHSTEVVEVPLAGMPAGEPEDVVLLKLGVSDASGLQILERSLEVIEANVDRSSWSRSALETSGWTVRELPDSVRLSSRDFLVSVDRATGVLKLDTSDGRSIVSGIFPRAARTLTMAESRNAKKQGLWLDRAMTQVEELQVEVEKENGSIALSVAGRYLRSDKPEQSLVGGYVLTFSEDGTLSLDYDYKPENADGYLSEAGLTLEFAEGFDSLRWIGDGPYAGYPGKDRLSDYGLWSLRADDLYFRGNRRDVDFAMLTNDAGLGVALLCESADVAVERVGSGVNLAHNAIIGSLGNKFRPPEVKLFAEDIESIAGRFMLIPLDGNWPESVVRWFGAPAAVVEVEKPYHHSYDQ